jgi:hypothetical protein
VDISYAMVSLGAMQIGRASSKRVRHARNQVMESLIIFLWSDMKQKNTLGPSLVLANYSWGLSSSNLKFFLIFKTMFGFSVLSHLISAYSDIFLNYSVFFSITDILPLSSGLGILSDSMKVEVSPNPIKNYPD